jgi:type I restriction-modification system DNA methylase subunit
MSTLLRKENIRDALGISLATVNNWIKTGYIPPPDVRDFYNENTYNDILRKIKGTSSKLSSRANRSLAEKKHISYLGITDKERKDELDKLIEIFENSELSIAEGVLALALAMLRSNKLITNDWEIRPTSKVDLLVSSWMIENNHNSKKIKDLYSGYDIQNKDDDLIGAFYQSIQSISQKSVSGSYYTPSELLQGIKIPIAKSVLDPCCGSGGILLRILNKDHDTSLVFARDIDEVALKICHVNLSMFFNNPNIESKIVKRDVAFDIEEDKLAFSAKEQFDFIVTNPPWGSKYSKTQKDYLIQMYSELGTTEIFSVALFNSMKLLKSNGQLYFFLPYSFLNVATHKNVRSHVLKSNNSVSVHLLGNAFKGVLSEGILVHVDNFAVKDDIYIYNKNGDKNIISKENVQQPDYLIPATASIIDEKIIRAMYKREYTTLKHNTVFALGVVTGDNKKHLLNIRTDSKNLEPIFRGKDIYCYKYLEAQCFIEFDPSTYQQVAPEEYYRQKKIVYRFISDRLVCHLDSNNSLVLNSANLFISRSYPMETIVCLFNSPLYSFIYQKKFHSKKVLKSHLQDLPLPLLESEQHKQFLILYRHILSHEATQADVDRLICKIFSLGQEEYAYVKGCVDGNS